MSSGATIGAIVRVGDQVQTLLSTLAALQRATRPPDVLVIVVDSSTPAAATDWIRARAAASGAAYVSAGGSRPGVVWNAGLASIAETDLAICVESGDLLDVEALRLLQAHFHDDTVALATCGIELVGPGARREFLVPPACSLEQVLADFHSVHVSSLFRRDVWERLRFDEELEALEFTDLWLRMLAGGTGVVENRPLLRRSVHRGALYRRTCETPAYGRSVRRVMERHLDAARGMAIVMLSARDRCHHDLLDRYRASLSKESAAHDSARAAVAAREALLASVPPDWDPGSAGFPLRVTPYSRDWGYDRGTPLDRPFIESFLEEWAGDIRGRVLEVQEDAYTRRFGRERVTRADVVDLNPSNPLASIVGDLRSLDHVPAELYDAIVLTQTVHVVDHMPAVFRECHRLLKPGGVLLATLPATSRVCLEYGRDGDHWRVTEAGARALVCDVFASAAVQTAVYGNALAIAAFTYGLASHEVPASTFDTADPYFPLLIGVRAVKTSGAPVIARGSRLPALGAASVSGLVLLYHRIDDPTFDPHGLCVARDTFAAQLRWLQARSSVVPLDQLLATSAAGDAHGPRVALTFDDGYVDNLTVAAPLLASLDLPATFFVTTAGLGDDGPYVFWWDRLAHTLLEVDVPATLPIDLPNGRVVMDAETAAARWQTHNRLHRELVSMPAAERDALVEQIEMQVGVSPGGSRSRRVTRGELRSLAAVKGATIGAHTQEHLALPLHPLDVVRQEMEQGRTVLESILATPVTLLAYPFGAADVHTADAARSTGFTGAVTCEERGLRDADDAMWIPRIAVREEPLETFAARIERAWSGRTLLARGRESRAT